MLKVHFCIFFSLLWVLTTATSANWFSFISNLGQKTMTMIYVWCICKCVWSFFCSFLLFYLHFSYGHQQAVPLPYACGLAQGFFPLKTDFSHRCCLFKKSSFCFLQSSQKESGLVGCSKNKAEWNWNIWAPSS